MCMTPSLPTRPTRRLLSRSRSRLIAGWMQILAVGLMTLQPFYSARALYVPSAEGAPVWLPLSGEPAEAPAAANDTPNPDGTLPWMLDFDAAVSSGTIRFWEGGTFPENGVWRSFGGQWYAATAAPGVADDSDADGIPDALDLHPQDASNNSFAWEGGTFQINGIRHAFRADLYLGSGEDANSDGLPDSLLSWFTDPSAHGTLQYWSGGTLLINGEWNTFDPVSYYADTSRDEDGDGLPDEIDPFPSDPWNNTYSVWGPLDAVINGVSTHFDQTTTPGDGADADGDGIPDMADPYPADAANNSVWWQGGSFWVPEQTVHVDFPGQWIAANTPDSNGDGVPDGISAPPPAPEENNQQTPTFVWPEASSTMLLGNVWTNFDPTTYSGPWADADSDGIPDVADPYPQDGYNANDSDADGLPDAVEALYPGLLDLNNSADATNLRPDGLTYLQVWSYYPGQPLDQPFGAGDGGGSGDEGGGEPTESEPDADGDGMPDAWELANGLDPFDPVDAAQSLMGDFVLNGEKYQLGLNPLVPVTQAEYESATGQSWSQFVANHVQNLSEPENDYDGDGVSNLDELVVFGTHHRDVNARPTDEQIIQAILATQVSATTLMNFQNLVGDGGGGGGGDGGTGGGGDGGGGGDDGGGDGGTGDGDGGDGTAPDVPTAYFVGKTYRWHQVAADAGDWIEQVSNTGVWTCNVMGSYRIALFDVWRVFYPDGTTQIALTEVTDNLMLEGIDVLDYGTSRTVVVVTEGPAPEYTPSPAPPDIGLLGPFQPGVGQNTTPSSPPPLGSVLAQ